MKKIFIFTILLICPLACSAFAETINLVSKPGQVEQYQPFFLEVKLPYFFKNPNDPAHVKVECVITSPSRQKITVPAFCRRNKASNNESIWEIRFTPVEKGRYNYSVKMESGLKSDATGVFNFDVRKKKGNGFLRKGDNNPFYPVFDSGKAFFGLGHNIGWTSGNSVEAFEAYFRDFKENNCNLVRIWINAPWALPIENTKLGVYNSINCGRLDEIIKLAEKYGVYIILVLDSYGSLMDEEGEWKENFWKNSPYNKARGGPCEEPKDFFKNEEAKRHYKNRLRYIISRWSYSPNVMTFELWNEMDVPPEWAREMMAFIKRINPHGQFLTTSLGYPWGNNFDEHEIWNLEDIDIIQWHVYGERIRDVIGNLVSINRALSDIYDDKMILVGEFSMDSSANDKNYDSSGEGVALHNSIWASALTRSFSSALNWWWAGYVKGKNLYPHYLAMSKFMENVDFNSHIVDFAWTTPVMYKNVSEEEATYSDVKIPTRKKWGEKSFMEFTVGNNGDISGGLVNGYLHGRLKSKFRVTPIFYVNYPVDGKFIVHVDLVSQGGTFIAYLDGKKVVSKEFPVGSGKGPWQRSMFRKDKKIYQCAYNTDIEIEVPKGRHTIQLENVGKDWIGMKRITLTNYKSSEFANARILGMVIGEETLLWVQNKDYNWRNIYKGMVVPEIKGAFFNVRAPESGVYQIEWWDTFKGEITSKQNLSPENGALRVDLPAFKKDVACKIRKLYRPE